VGVVDEAVDGGGCDDVVAEGLSPSREREVGRHDDGPGLVARGDELEEQRRRRRVEREVAHLVNHDHAVAVQSGTLTFSDGSAVAFGPLPNDGSSLTVSFARRTTTGVRLTVTSVLKGTQNVGLAEIEVWSPTAGGPSQASPLAAAGPDQTVASGATVTLDGSQSVDPNGGSLVYAWSQTAGPSVGLSSSSTAAPSFTAPDGPATLTFSLVVFAGRCRARRTR